MSTHEFPVPIHDLDAGGKQFDFPIRREWLRGVLEGEDVRAGDRDGALGVRVSKSGNDVVVHGRVSADLETTCARCLGVAKVHVDEPVSVLMVPASQARAERPGRPGKDDDDDDRPIDEADVVTYEGDTVVLDDLVRDELLLAMPMIPLCSEDCPGISPPLTQDTQEASQATERAIDPRLAPLLDLRNALSAAAPKPPPKPSNANANKKPKE